MSIRRFTRSKKAWIVTVIVFLVRIYLYICIYIPLWFLVDKSQIYVYTYSSHIFLCDILERFNWFIVFRSLVVIFGFYKIYTRQHVVDTCPDHKRTNKHCLTHGNNYEICLVSTTLYTICVYISVYICTRIDFIQYMYIMCIYICVYMQVSYLSSV